jgi:hypothetical protein
MFVTVTPLTSDCFPLPHPPKTEDLDPLSPPTATDLPFPSSDANQSRLAGRPRPSRGDLRGKAVQPWRSTKTRSRSPTPSSRWTVSLSPPAPASSLPTDPPSSVAPSRQIALRLGFAPRPFSVEVSQEIPQIHRTCSISYAGAGGPC